MQDIVISAGGTSSRLNDAPH